MLLAIEMKGSVLTDRSLCSTLLDNQLVEFCMWLYSSSSGSQPQLDEHIVVLVVGDAEAITFEHFSVCHASIAEENLRSFWEGILTSLEDEGEVLGHVVDNLVPDCLSHVFAHFNFLLTRIGLAHLCKFTRFDAMTIVAESLLFDKQVKIVVTFKTT